MHKYLLAIPLALMMSACAGEGTADESAETSAPAPVTAESLLDDYQAACNEVVALTDSVKSGNTKKAKELLESSNKVQQISAKIRGMAKEMTPEENHRFAEIATQFNADVKKVRSKSEE